MPPLFFRSATLPIRLFVAAPAETPTWFLLSAFANDALKATGGSDMREGSRSGVGGRKERLRGILGAAGAGHHMGLDVARVPGVELAVDQRVQQDFGFVAGHAGDPSATFHAERNMERARASRDITVPTGTPATSAIC